VVVQANLVPTSRLQCVGSPQRHISSPQVAKYQTTVSLDHYAGILVVFSVENRRCLPGFTSRRHDSRHIAEHDKIVAVGMHPSMCTHKSRVTFNVVI
jgi:hypothetical protein